jgi:hypothetical protein
MKNIQAIPENYTSNFAQAQPAILYSYSLSYDITRIIAGVNYEIRSAEVLDLLSWKPL